MKADFHIHTTYTDGSDTPEEVFRLAHENGVEILSITDHDTLIGREEYEALGKKYNIIYVPGIEVSAYDYKRNRPCHIIGLYVKLGSLPLEVMIDKITKERQSNSERQIEILTELGYSISIQDFINRQGDKGIYKQHIMEVLINKGYAKSIYDEFYNKMFKNKGPLVMTIDYPSHIDAVRALKSAGAIPILAHPTLYNSLECVEELCEVGLEGIEINYPFVKQEDQRIIQQLAETYNLLLSGGSDYHGFYAGHSTGSVGSFSIDITSTYLNRDND